MVGSESAADCDTHKCDGDLYCRACDNYFCKDCRGLEGNCMNCGAPLWEVR